MSQISVAGGSQGENSIFMNEKLDSIYNLALKNSKPNR
jgi:hypothetical protein